MTDDVSREEKSARDKILVDIISKTGLAANKKYVGHEVEVLVDKINKKGKIASKTSSYKDVFFTSDKYKASELIGRFVKVKITKARDLCLEGELVAIEG
jgi:tRNA A37 methylthiotransferase MiaB